jgi:hypothetical protein
MIFSGTAQADSFLLTEWVTWPYSLIEVTAAVFVHPLTEGLSDA